MRDDERAARAFLTELLREVSGDQLRAGLRNLQVAARVIRVRMRVDDEANRLVAGHLSNCLEHVVRILLALRVHDEHALLTDLDHRIARGPRQQIYLAVDFEDVDGRRSLLRRNRGGAAKQHGPGREDPGTGPFVPELTRAKHGPF